MKNIRISDATMRQTSEAFRLSFKEKIELSKLLDKLGVDIIELDYIKNVRIDSLQIKSIISAVKRSTVAVPVEMNGESIKTTWNALQGAVHPRLQVIAPASQVQIEYLYHKKPDSMLETMTEAVRSCKALCCDVELVIEDATRSEQAFLTKMINTAIEAGATTVTLCDTAGTMLPSEFADFIRKQLEALPSLKDIALGVSCANTISMADACAVAAVGEGATQIRCAAYPIDAVSLCNVARIISAKEDSLGANCSIAVNQMSRIIDQINWLCNPSKNEVSAIAVGANENEDVFLTSHDDEAAVSSAVKKLGYDLSEYDEGKVYAAFCQIAEKKEKVSFKELDAIVASSAMQVPPTYKLNTYVITSGNTISATAHIKLEKNSQTVEGVYIGDGSIDAAFQAIEKITGCHYELDDFQLQAVTEGREAMGQTVVKLRAGGKVYSGRGISTDIVGAGIQAYLSALNKIIYEEDNE